MPVFFFLFMRLFCDRDSSFDLRIDVVHADKQFFKDREIVGNDHSGFLICQDLLDRKIEELREVLEMIVLDGDLQHLVVDDLLAVIAEFFEIVL